MKIWKRLAWCALNAFAAVLGMMIVTGLYDEQVMYPVGGPWWHPVFKFGSPLYGLTWMHLMVTTLAALTIGITWWRTGKPR